jgi:hypothetical protein
MSIALCFWHQPAVVTGGRVTVEYKQFKLFCFGYTWSVGNAHPTFLKSFVTWAKTQEIYEDISKAATQELKQRNL